MVHNVSNRGSVFLIMPACTSSWQTYGCECGIPCLWQSMGLLRRLDVMVLAFMLARVIAILGRAAYRYHSIRRSPATDTNIRKVVAAELTLRLYTLRSIAHTAPFFGLAGSCVGIFRLFHRNWNGERDRAGNHRSESGQGPDHNRCGDARHCSSNLFPQLPPDAVGLA